MSTLTERLAPTLLDGLRPPRRRRDRARRQDALRRSRAPRPDGRRQSRSDRRLAGIDTEMRVVGRGVFPFFGRGSFTPAGLGVGALLLSPRPGSLNPEQQPGFNFVLIDVAARGPPRRRGRAGHARPREAQALRHRQQCTVTNASRPIDVLNYARVQSTPIALAAMLAGLGALGARLRPAHVAAPPSPRLRRAEDARVHTSPGVVDDRVERDGARALALLSASRSASSPDVRRGASSPPTSACRPTWPARHRSDLAAAIALVIANLTAAAPAVLEVAPPAPAPALRTD